MPNYRYTAFISYRHTLPDEAIAKKLHTLIETYGIPADVKKSSGRKKMGTVFRDQDELPLSTDLGNDIKTALNESEWLIVICSPDYLQSRWCLTELNHFISLGRRDHILTLLVNGEPSEAFPEQLCYIETENGRVPVEPLAGDTRAESLSASLKKLKQEKLRILAPILNVSYDTLRQRERRRKIRIAAATSFAAMLLLAGFLTYALIKNAQITEQNRKISAQNAEILEQRDEIAGQRDEIAGQRDEIAKQRDEIVDHHMQTLLEQSKTSVSTGNKIPATNILREASELRESVTSRYDDALYSALEAAVYTSSFETVQTIDNDNRIFSSIIFSHNDQYLLGITNLNSAALIDAESGTLLYTVSRSDIGQLSSVGFTTDDRYFYTVDSWYGYVSLYETKTGKLYREFNANDGMAWNIGEEVFALSKHRIIVPMRTSLCVWDYEADTGEDILMTEGGLDTYIQPFLVDLSPDETKVVMGSPGYGIGMKIRSLDGETEIDLENDSSRGYFPIRFSGNGRFVAAGSGNLYTVWDAKTGKIILQGSADIPALNALEVRLNNDGSVLILMETEYLAAVSVPQGKLLWEKTAESNIVTTAVISPNGKYVASAGGIEGVFDIRTGEVLTDLPCTAFSHDGKKVLTGNYTTSPALLTTPESATSRIVNEYDGELFTTPRYTAPSFSPMISTRHIVGDYYKSFPGNINRKVAAYIDPATHYLAYTHEDGFIEVFDISDPEDIRPAFCVAEHCFNSVEDIVFNGNLMASSGGYDPRCAVFDLETGTMLHVLRGEGYVHLSEFSEDGSKLMILTGAGKTTVLVYSVQTANLLYRIDAPEGTSFTEIGFQTDGTLAVMKLSDGRAVIGELYSSIDEMVEKNR